MSAFSRLTFWCQDCTKSKCRAAAKSPLSNHMTAASFVPPNPATWSWGQPLPPQSRQKTLRFHLEDVFLFVPLKRGPPETEIHTNFNPYLKIPHRWHRQAYGNLSLKVLSASSMAPDSVFHAKKKSETPNDSNVFHVHNRLKIQIFQVLHWVHHHSSRCCILVVEANHSKHPSVETIPSCTCQPVKPSTNQWSWSPRRCPA